PKLADDRFAGEAVKTIALYPRRVQRLGNRKAARDLRQPRVERGVEARRLRHMQRREGPRSPKLPQHRLVDEAVTPKLRAAMNDAMPDDRGSRQPAVGE